jgi:fatty-acyl-CoA synthase
MHGLVMQTPLLLSSILRYSSTRRADTGIVSRAPDKPDHRTTYKGLAGHAVARRRQLF